MKIIILSAIQPEYEINFDAAGLAAGVYIYTVQAGGYTKSGHMVLMK